MTHDLKSFIIETAIDAGKLVRVSYGTIKTWQTKTGPSDIVTEAENPSISFSPKTAFPLTRPRAES